MTLTNRRGRSERRVAIVHKKTETDRRLTRITFEEPALWAGRAFLSHDYFDSAAADERWMYLPARETMRTIPASKRGDAFLGTDFSYADIQSELKFDLADWRFEYRGDEIVDGRRMHRLTGEPRSERIARELRYGGFEALIDDESAMPIRIDFDDLRGQPLKTIELKTFGRVDGIWTPRDVTATNHQKQHKSRFVFRDIVYPDELPDSVFDSRALGRSLSAGSGD